jgi:hypothetical protein
MSDLPAASTTWLADHHGVITTTALRDHRVGESTVARLVRSAVLRRVAKGVFVIASAPSTLEQRCVIQCAAHPAGFVTGPTAGTLAALRRMPQATAIHFSMAHGRHLAREPGVRWRQTTVIWTVDRVTRDDGVVVASWPRLAFDLAVDLRQLDHISAVNQLLEQERVTVDELVAIERRLGHPARPGSGVFRRTLDAVSGGAPQGSHPEVRLADALRRRGVPVEQQVRVVAPSHGRSLHIDLAVPDARWGIELDIHPEHRSIEGHAADANRRREMHRAGWQIEVVTEHDMLRVEAVAADLAALYILRRRSLLDHPSVS